MHKNRLHLGGREVKAFLIFFYVLNFVLYILYVTVRQNFKSFSEMVPGSGLVRSIKNMSGLSCFKNIFIFIFVKKTLADASFFWRANLCCQEQIL